MQSIVPQLRDLVLVGGGHSHALVLRRWGMTPLPGVRLTVIDPTPVTAYSGMLPGFVAGHYERTEMEIDLVRLCRFAGARLIIGPATGIDPAARQIIVPGRAPVAYDIASIDIGITARMPDLPGFAAHGVPAKPLGAFSEQWTAYVAQVQSGVSRPQVAVIGGGVAGAELALNMQHRLTQTSSQPVEMTVIDRSAALAGVSAKSARILRDRLASAGITVCEAAEIAQITAEAVELTDGRSVPATLVVGAAGATPAPWIAHSGLAQEAGFIAVDQDLRSLSHTTVFAAGDCAHMSAAPRPKAGVFAVRAAPVLDHNLRAALQGRPTRPYRPQSSYLKLVSLGPKDALAQKGPLSLAAPLMWQWKDRIDRKFMEKLQDLPAMAPDQRRRATTLADAPTGDQPLCGGCGSKVGPGVLSAALAALPDQRVEGLLTGPGDDAAILRAGDGFQVISTDHLRAFVDDPDRMARIALFHAMGDIWAMGATPQTALAQIILPQMSDALQARTLTETTTATAQSTAAIGAALAGGHTTMGAELTLGFTVTGTCSRAPITKGGARPGDILLLTRPIGSGTLLAADMQMKANGRWITTLLDTLATHQAREAAILAEHAHAMTDVTGFGLAGHALEMAQASGVGVALDVTDIPLFEGAAALSAAGIRSTIYTANRAACLSHIDGERDEARNALLHDPQTCGGFLAALPAQAAIEAVAQIAAAGGRAWAIGKVMGGPARLIVR